MTLIESIKTLLFTSSMTDNSMKTLKWFEFDSCQRFSKDYFTAGRRVNMNQNL